MALISVEEALRSVLDGTAALPVETVPLDHAIHRVLAADIVARRSQPPAAMSAMDGYAVRTADAARVPVTLRVAGEVAAGRPFGGTVEPGTAVRIFTGGVVPDGADAIVIQEDTTRDSDLVTVREAATAGRHIRPAGVDFREGAVILTAGRRLSDRDLALAAAMNHPVLPVRRKPKVAILATGDELVPPGTDPGPGQIVYSNGFALRALAEHEGAEVIDLGVVPDRIDATVAAIRAARDARADVLLTTGGASVGDHDLVHHALHDQGVEMTFWKVAMRPGKPMMHGRLGGLRVLGLPGNPVSSYVCGFLFAGPLIRALLGRPDIVPMPEPAILGRDLPANDLRQDYLRAALSRDGDGETVATPFPNQDSSLLSVLSAAGALVIRPPFAPAAKAGAPCAILKLPL
jgi:molybdopterin molybdotransferase